MTRSRHWPRPRPRPRPLLVVGVTWLLRLAAGAGCASILARAFPYRATVDGVPFQVQATIFTRRGLSADTSLGSWQFPHVTALPVGVHITPVDVDLLRLTRASSGDTATYVNELRDHFTHAIPAIVAWLGGEILLGFIAGLLIFWVGELAFRSLRSWPARGHELRRELLWQGSGVLALAVVLLVGYFSYNPSWARQSRLTGTLAAFQLFPDQLQQYYIQQNKAYDVLGSVIGIQAALQNRLEQQDVPDTAFNIMYISDVHLAAVYPLVAQYAHNFDVKLIVNTGDESEFGSAAEMTSSFTSSIAALTKTIPMIWVAGNHDSPEVLDIMKAIPGVTVLGTKVRNGSGIDVTASYVRAFGLTIAGVPDPRVYGAAGVYGSDDDTATDTLEHLAVDGALKNLLTAQKNGLAKKTFDIFATHEPAAASELNKDLPGQIRQLNSGHVHKQNDSADVQKGSPINLVEGSTGAGGLDNLHLGSAKPPVEFSIESVASDCQFTRVLRFQVDSSVTTSSADAATFGGDVTVATLYLEEQQLDPDRVCDTASGISAVPMALSAAG